MSYTQTTAGDFDWYEKTANCDDGDNELRKEPDMFSQSATTGERETFHYSECRPDGRVELGTKITDESLLMAGVTSVRSRHFHTDMQGNVNARLRESRI